MWDIIPYICIPIYIIFFRTVLFLNIAKTILIRKLEPRGLSS